VSVGSCGLVRPGARSRHRERTKYAVVAEAVTNEVSTHSRPSTKPLQQDKSSGGMVVGLSRSESASLAERVTATICL